MRNAAREDGQRESLPSLCIKCGRRWPRPAFRPDLPRLPSLAIIYIRSFATVSGSRRRLRARSPLSFPLPIANYRLFKQKYTSANLNTTFTLLLQVTSLISHVATLWKGLSFLPSFLPSVFRPLFSPSLPPPLLLPRASQFCISIRYVKAAAAAAGKKRTGRLALLPPLGLEEHRRRHITLLYAQKEKEGEERFV